MSKLIDRLLFGLLTTLDTLFPGWAEAGKPASDVGTLSAESLNYWLTAERHRRSRD